jgi:hypothetical protein
MLIDNYTTLFKDDFDLIINNNPNNVEIDMKIRELIEFMMYHQNTIENVNYVKNELSKLKC